MVRAKAALDSATTVKKYQPRRMAVAGSVMLSMRVRSLLQVKLEASGKVSALPYSTACPLYRLQVMLRLRSCEARMPGTVSNGQ